MTTTLNPLRNARNISTGGTGGDIERRIEDLETDVERALIGNHVYSTTERVCGEWIDGKPIYEKTIVLDNIIVVNGWTDISDVVPDLSIETAIRCTCLRTEEGDRGYAVGEFMFWHDKGNGIKVYSSTALGIKVLILQYTKLEV